MTDAVLSAAALWNVADPLMQAAHALADVARVPALRHFREAGLAADNKAGPVGYDPVTAADRAAEDAMRDALARLRPEDGILGEERGVSEGTSGLTWVLDPIDGTRAYVVGAPTWGVLIGLRDAERAVLGVMDQPWTGERFWGDGAEAWAARPGLEGAPGAAPRRLATRSAASLEEARICSTFPEVGTPEEREAFHALARRCRLTRYGLDCTAYALLAAGHVDLVVEAGLQPYDILALIPIVEGAGGVITTWDGAPALSGGRVLAAANRRLHDAAMNALADA